MTSRRKKKKNKVKILNKVTEIIFKKPNKNSNIKQQQVMVFTIDCWSCSLINVALSISVYNNLNLVSLYQIHLIFFHIAFNLVQSSFLPLLSQFRLQTLNSRQQVLVLNSGVSFLILYYFSFV